MANSSKKGEKGKERQGISSPQQTASHFLCVSSPHTQLIYLETKIRPNLLIKDSRPANIISVFY